MTLPQKNGHRIDPNAFIKMNDLGVILLEKIILYAIMDTAFLYILFHVFLKSLIVSVAFFLGHPVYRQEPYRKEHIVATV